MCGCALSAAPTRRVRTDTGNPAYISPAENTMQLFMGQRDMVGVARHIMELVLMCLVPLMMLLVMHQYYLHQPWRLDRSTSVIIHWSPIERLPSAQPIRIPLCASALHSPCLPESALTCVHARMLANLLGPVAIHASPWVTEIPTQRMVSGGAPQGPYLAGYTAVEGTPLSYGLRRLDHAVGNVPVMDDVTRYIRAATGFHEFAEFTAEARAPSLCAHGLHSLLCAPGAVVGASEYVLGPAAITLLGSI